MSRTKRPVQAARDKPMSIVGTDNRSVVNNLSADPFDSVVAVDTLISPGSGGSGSGIIIGPNQVLTAGHVVTRENGFLTSLFGPDFAPAQGVRTTPGQNVPSLPSRTTNLISTSSFNATAGDLSFPADGYNGGGGGDDLALITVNQSFPVAQQIGIVAFVDPSDANGRTVTTGGYPALVETINLQNSNNAQFLITDANGNPSVPVNYAGGAFLTDGLVQFSATGTIDSTSNDGTFSLSPAIDIEAGQSGSGYWTILDGDQDPRVLGVASYQTNTTPGGFLGIGANPGDNFGALITTDVYDNIVAAIAAASTNLSGNNLPENAIVGSNPGFFSFLTGNGKDDIFGSFLRERIIGQGGNDRLFGGGANDRLEGGDGVDQALFSDIFTNYSFTITDPTNPAFQFDHTGGTMADGMDTTQDIEFGVFEFVDGNNDGNDDDGDLFFVPLQVDPDDNTKLKDGPEITPEVDILDEDGETIGTITVESPAWTFDGDVEYTLTLGSEQGTLFNFAYIIDVSGSVRGTPLQEAQNAYVTLTNSLVNRGVADNSRFAVIPFSSSASLIGPLTPTDAISTIQGLTAGGGTNFNAALTQANQFFSGSSGASNIAYFLSDGLSNTGGDFSSSAAALQSVADVRAFGIGGADIGALNIIDSGSAEFLSDPSDLDDAFTAATVGRDTIERIDVKLAGNVIEMIAPSQLTEDTLGLQFEGTIDGLEMTRTAENEIMFDVVFNNGTPTASLSYIITTGQEQVTQQTNNGTQEVIIFSVNQSDFTATSATNQSISREINGNDLDNVITVEDGNNTLLGNGGNDRFILSGGINLVDGGEGIDTVAIDMTQVEAGEISQTGNVINIGTDTTLLNVEFIEFSDVRLATTDDTPIVTPILSLAETGISITEGDPNSNQATFTINLSSVTTEDVVIDFATQSNVANAGTDFVEATGQLTIAAGESSGDITVEVLDDSDVEGEELVLLTLMAVSGATFADGAINQTAAINILDNDSAIALPLTGFPIVIEGDPDDDEQTLLTLEIERLGSSSGTDTIEVEILAAGTNPAQASDFVDGFSSTQVTFALDEETKTVDIAITPDEEIEEDETFGIRLNSVSGSASVANGETLFTIFDNDAPDRQIGQNPIISNTSDQNDNNILVLDLGGELTFTITANANESAFSQQLVAILGDNSIPILSTLGNASGLPGTFSTSNLSIRALLGTGEFQLGLQAPDRDTVTPLDLSNVTSNGFNLSGGGVEIAVTIPDGTEQVFVETTTVGEETALGVEITDGVNNAPNAQVTVSATLHREAAFDNTIGFYLIDAANDGAVIDPLTGQAITGSTSSNRLGHLQAAIDNTLISAAAPSNNQTRPIDETFDITNLDTDVQLFLVPYLISSELPSDFSNMYSSFLGTNADGAEHVRLLSNNAFGFEDLAGGGDNDFDDIVVEINGIQVI